MKYFIGFILTALLLLTNVYEGIALTVADLVDRDM